MTHGIRQFKNYDAANAYLKTAVPFKRGEAKGQVPLGDRRYNKALIRKDENGDIHCRLYDTDITTFKCNGDIVIRMNGWCTQTTCNALHNIHRTNFMIHNHRLWMGFGAPEQRKTSWGYTYFTYSDMKPLFLHKENVIRRAERGGFDPVVIARAVKHLLIRREANNVRQMLQPFREYFTNNVKLRDKQGPDAEEFCAAWGVPADHYLELYKENRIEVSSYSRPNRHAITAFIRLASSEGETQHEDFYKASLMIYQSVPSHWARPIGDYMKCVDNALLYHYRDKCFKKVEVEAGKIFRDPNRRFFHPDDENT